MPGLFRVWLHLRAAQAMGAESEWRRLVSEKTPVATDTPSMFSLDEESAELRLPERMDLNRAETDGRHHLRAMWWHAAWLAACREVRERYGMALHIHCAGKRRVGADGSRATVCHTMGAIYEMLHVEPQEQGAKHGRDTALLVLWDELRRELRRLKVGVPKETFGHFRHRSDVQAGCSVFDRKTVKAFWDYLVRAVDERRWNAIFYLRESMAPPEALVKPDLQDIPMDAVESHPDDWYKWRGFWKQAQSFEEGYALLNKVWRESQQYHAEARLLLWQSKEAIFNRETADATADRGNVVVLQHPHYKKTYRGRLRLAGDKWIFQEDGTWFEVHVDLDTPTTGKHDQPDIDVKLYNAVRGAHAKREVWARSLERHNKIFADLPTQASDMTVQGTTPAGKLTYTFRDREVVVTPRLLRKQESGSQSKWKRARAVETTPERALYKMRAKMKRQLEKARRGECERIVVRASAAEASPGGQEQPCGEAAHSALYESCPALQQLNDPIALGHTRLAYEFLGSMRLFYCKNCDEQWPVFEEPWPQGGTDCAGPKAGKCETIMRADWKKSYRHDDLCSRCATPTSAYAKMYSEENLQHLGPPSEILSNLTWYESLLIARVHPVISVVTLAATGMFCFADHVCNYYVKIMEWFCGLPAILRDKKWFLIKCRCSNRASVRDMRQKKPTTASRERLEAAIAGVQKRMLRVYGNSVVAREALERFPMGTHTKRLSGFRVRSVPSFKTRWACLTGRQ